MKRFLGLPDYLIEETCREAARYGMTPEETAAAVAFLKQRRYNLYHLVHEHENEFASAHTRTRRP